MPSAFYLNTLIIISLFLILPVPVETGLADEHPQAHAELGAGGGDGLAHGRQLGLIGPTPTTPATPVGARYSPNTSRSAPGPLARRHAGARAGEGGGHEVLVGRRDAPQLGQRRLDRGRVARRPSSACEPRDRLRLDRGVDASAIAARRPRR